MEFEAIVKLLFRSSEAKREQQKHDEHSRNDKAFDRERKSANSLSKTVKWAEILTVCQQRENGLQCVRLEQRHNLFPSRLCAVVVSLGTFTSGRLSSHPRRSIFKCLSFIHSSLVMECWQICCAKSELFLLKNCSSGEGIEWKQGAWT